MPDIAPSIAEHLRSFGIHRFDSESYWEWGAIQLGDKRINRLNKLREPLMGDPTPQQLQKFYDFIADPAVAAVVHSMKADAIRISGEMASLLLPAAGRILDVGCSIGYLSTYYALCGPSRSVVGCDFSPASITRARREAATRFVINVEFQQADVSDALPDGLFDAIVSTQVLGSLDNRGAALGRVAAALAPMGILHSIEALGTPAEAELYLSDAAAVGLRPVSFCFAHFNDLGASGAYPVFRLAVTSDIFKLDLEREYQADAAS